MTGVFVVGLGLAIVNDLWRRTIPNSITVPLLAGGLWYAYQTGGSPEVGRHLAGVIILGGIFFFTWGAGGVGGGDVKLAAAIGAWAGTRLAAILLWFAGMNAVVATFLRWKACGYSWARLWKTEGPMVQALMHGVLTPSTVGYPGGVTLGVATLVAMVGR